jgi:hypothetical protein
MRGDGMPVLAAADGHQSVAATDVGRAARDAAAKVA